MIQLIVQTTVMVDGARATRMVVVANGSVYGGDINGVSLLSGGSNLFSPGQRIQGIAGQGKIYLLDGNVIQQIDASTMALSLYADTAGDAPEHVSFGAVWRDRLVVAGSTGDEQNFFASRSGTHTDWDYSQTDAAAAFAGNASLAGRIGDIITALIPFRDDVLLIGGDHSMWKMEGDLSAGGSLTMISDANGVLGPNAWCTDPAGNVYLVSTDGFFRVQVDGGMQNVSGDRVAEFFRSIDRSANYIECQWDTGRKGCWIFITPHASTAARHLFWDARMDAFLPMQFPVRFGPVTSVVFDGDADDDRMLLMGGRDGLIQVLDDEARTDDGDTISSEVLMGPVRPAGDVENAKLLTLDITMGERAAGDTTTPWNAEWVLQAGSEAHEALVSPDRSTSGTITTPGAQQRIGAPYAGQTFWFKLWNATSGTYWAMDRIVGRYQWAGKRR